MDKLKQAARQLLIDIAVGNGTDKSLTALREALAEQAEQEPVGTVGQLFDDHVIAKSGLDKNRMVYLAPVRTKDLTDDEIANKIPHQPVAINMIDFARAVIAADREKNK